MGERAARRWRGRRCAAFALGAVVHGLLVPAPMAAQESVEARNRVSFRVEAARDVENDRVEAVLVASAEATDPADVAATVNEAMAWALERARGRAGVSVRSGGYNTHPVYDDGRIRRWRARQELFLGSADTEALVASVSELQARLALESFEFSLSDERRRRTEDALIEEALQGFRERADLVRRSLDARAWRIDELSINSDRGVVPRRQLERGAVLSAAAAPVAAEAGKSRVALQVHATIMLE